MVRYAVMNEIKQDTVEVNIVDDDNMEAGCPVISDGKTVFLDPGDTRTLIVSDSGSGKTRRLVLPTLVSMAKSGENVIIHDPKGELYKYTGKIFKEKGYNVIVLNLRNPLTGQQFNPLHYPAFLYKTGNKSKATELFMDFSISLYEPMVNKDDPFWVDMSEQYFTGLCLLACELFPIEKITLNNIFELHLQAKDKEGLSGKTAFQIFFGEYEEEENNKLKYGHIWRLLEGTVESALETKASILSTFSQPLARLILNDNISDMLSASSFDISKICDEKTAIFLCTRDETRVYDGLISGIMHQLYVSVIETAEEKYSSVLPIRMNFMLEELGCMAKIMDLNSKLTASRSRNIRMYLVVQSLQQLTLIYGEMESQIILGNTDTQFYFHSSDISLLDFFSNKAGITTTKYTNEKRPLLSPSELLHFDKESGQVLVFLKRNYPFVTYLPDISQYEIDYLGEMLKLERRDRTYTGIIDFSCYAKAIIDRVHQRMESELSKDEPEEELLDPEDDFLLEDKEEESCDEIQLLEKKIERLLEKIDRLEETEF